METVIFMIMNTIMIIGLHFVYTNNYCDVSDHDSRLLFHYSNGQAVSCYLIHEITIRIESIITGADPERGSEYRGDL